MVMKMIGYETVSHFVFTLFYDRLGHCSDRHLPPSYYRVYFERGGSWFNCGAKNSLVISGQFHGLFP
jgi:hypothetical protein